PSARRRASLAGYADAGCGAAGCPQRGPRPPPARRLSCSSSRDSLVVEPVVAGRGRPATAVASLLQDRGDLLVVGLEGVGALEDVVADHDHPGAVGCVERL